MKTEEYFNSLLKESSAIFDKSIKTCEAFTRAHCYAHDIYKISRLIHDADERKMLEAACSQMEAGSFALSLGLHRSAFSSLRLSLELGLGAIYFSTNKLVHREWINGVKTADIKWSSINCPDNGILSTRFALAFFPELKSHAIAYQEKSNKLYRELSQYVHGNYETWVATGIKLEYKPELVNDFLNFITQAAEIIKFSLCCRYLKEISKDNLEEIEFTLNEEFNHIEPIRVHFGGPKDIK